MASFMCLNRAFYIDKYLDETDNGIIEKTHDFEQYVERLSQIKNEVYEIQKSLENVLRGYQRLVFNGLSF